MNGNGFDLMKIYDENGKKDDRLAPKAVMVFPTVRLETTQDHGGGVGS